MLYPFKKAFAGSLAALCLLGSAWGQVTNSISFTTNSAVSTNAQYVGLSLGKFNTDLGTLTGVTVAINFATISGNVTISLVPDAEEPTTISRLNSIMRFRQSSTNALGFSNRTITRTNIAFNPAFPYTLQPGDSVQFNVSPSPTNASINFSTNIATNFWSAYRSAGGGQFVAFEFQLEGQPFITQGSIPTYNGSQFQGIGNMSVTYTYTSAEPIPEPSTVAAGAFLTLVAAASYWRRRRNSSAAKN